MRPTDKVNAFFKRAHLPLYIGPWWTWVALWRGAGSRVGFFRNRPGVIKWLPGHLLPRRWGIFILGFEFGRRG